LRITSEAAEALTLHLSHPIARTLASGTILIGIASARVAPGLPDSESRDGEIVDGCSIPNVHLEDGTRSANPRENLADAAQRLLSDVRETHYQHKTHVDRTEGVYNMDCSGFVDYLLKRIAPRQFGQLPIESGHARPRAAMYFQLLHRLREQPLPGWEAIRQLAHARRGDIIAWELQASTQEPGDTGHVVIVAADPIQETQIICRVEVYDSSGIHHDDDSRLEHTSGVGKGIITFRVNESGEPISFQFNSRAHFHDEPIAIGRLVSQ